MKSKGLLLLIAILMLGLTAAAIRSNATSKISVPTELLSRDSIRVWVFFVDKGESIGKLAKPGAVAQKAMVRRFKRASLTSFEEMDRGVSQDYIGQIQPLVQRTIHPSRWLNAVSAIVTPDQLDDIASLECVKEVRLVATYRRAPEPVDQSLPPLRKSNVPSPPEYGDGWVQLNQIQIPALHSLGYKGEGVTILMLDTGFDTQHQAFRDTDIEATFDFINGDEDVRDEFGDQRSHGTATLSLIGATDVDTLLGAAYNATFLLGKTEVYSGETVIEEDNWVAGIEWGEGLGCDLVSSSLGYVDWYDYSDMDGNTAVTTKAADIAAALGVVVVNSIGNGNHNGSEPSLIAPSDGDSVIAIGAVDQGGEIVSFSSNGPTFDGRIKPDLCAMGTANTVASYFNGGYSSGSGTSYSCPIVAGAVALLLQAHPDWTFGDVYAALTTTSTRANSPDNVYGYGIVRALDALDYEGHTGVDINGIVAYPNPFVSGVDFGFEVPPVGAVEIRIYTVAGEKIATIRREDGDPATPHWDGKNQDGEEVAPGVYVAYISADGISETKKLFKTGS